MYTVQLVISVIGAIELHVTEEEIRCVFYI